MKELFTSEGCRITVYEKPFKFNFMTSFYEFCQSSLFRIGWGDGETDSMRQNSYLHSEFSEDDLVRSGLLGAINSSDARQELEGYDIQRCVVNLSTPADCHFPHVHNDADKVLLYYVNLEWREGWHGETLFYSDDKQTIEHAMNYTPGRVIAFDASIPHSVRPQSHICDKYRFTFAVMLKKR